MVRYRIVYSRFEADWSYLENARRCLPKQARRLTRHLAAHWIAIDPTDPYPRFEATAMPWTGKPGALQFGPLPTARFTRSCVEALEDAFDLCRNHALLLQTPHAVACAYKQMGRCPAPCDGTVPLSVYIAQVERAVDVLKDIPSWITGLTERMKAAAAELQYEAAGAAKTLLDRTKPLVHYESRMLRPVDRLGWLILQRASRADRVRLFVAASGRIVCLGEVSRKKLSDHTAQIIAEARRAADQAAPASWLDCEDSAARLNLTSFHALHADHPAARRGLFIPLDSLDDQAVTRALDTAAPGPPAIPANE
jgi:excinuclease UvrABC nuclease subunit